MEAFSYFTGSGIRDFAFESLDAVKITYCLKTAPETNFFEVQNRAEI